MKDQVAFSCRRKVKAIHVGDCGDDEVMEDFRWSIEFPAETLLTDMRWIDMLQSPHSLLHGCGQITLLRGATISDYVMTHLIIGGEA